MDYEKKTKKKTLHKVIRFEGSYNTFLEFGWIENPTYKNDIYIMTSSKHEPKEDLTELRTDEALLYIQGLANALNRKVTGLETKEK